MKLLKTCFYFALIFCSGFLLAQEDNTLKQIQFPTSELVFESTTFNYGTIEAGEIVQTVFTFTNTGSEPIVISNAKGSCGCTVPEWPKEPITAGETGQLVVRFDSKNKVGMQSKRVTVTANTDPVNTYLTVKGEVIKVEEKVKKNNNSNKPIQRLVNLDVTDVSIYPNPTSETLNVKLDNLKDTQANIYVYNSSGKLIDSKQLKHNGQQEVKFDVSQYESGLYTVSVKTDNLNRIAKQVSIVTN